jgi:hypothetical protein
MNLAQFQMDMSKLSINELLEERKRISQSIMTTFTLQENMDELVQKAAIIDELIAGKRETA